MRTKLRKSIVMASLLAASAGGAQAADVFIPGVIKFESWLQNAVAGNPAELGGANLDDATVLPLIPSFGTPTDTLYMTSFNTRTVYPNDTHENYLARMTGVLIVPVSGDYHFFLRADDDARFYLNKTGETSPDITSGTVVPLIKEDIDCCDGFIAPGLDEDGDGFGDGDAEATTVTPVALVAGTRYGFTALLKEGGGGDFFELDVRKSDDTRGNAPLPGSFVGVLSPATSITTQPASASVSENFPTTLSVGVSNEAGVTYQGQVGGVAIAGATNRVYSFTPVIGDNGKKYKVVVTQAGAALTSSEATLTVTQDSTAPTIVSIGNFLDRNGFTVIYSEPVGAAAATAANYAVDGGVTVNSAQVLSPDTIWVGTSAMTAGQLRTVTVSNVKDLATGGGNAVTPNTKTFTPLATPSGTALQAVGYARYESTADWAAFQTKLTDGTAADVTGLRTGMEAPVNVAETHGTVMRTYFIAPETGHYTFYGHSDDRGEFFLSTDSDPANKKRIAVESTWSDNRQWTTSGGASTLADKRSDQYSASEWPGGGDNIVLVKGQKYYAEVQFLEGGGGDNGGMNFSLDGSAQFPVPENGSRTLMALTNVAWYGNAADFMFEALPPSSKVFKKGDTVTLEPVISGPGSVTYQWYKNKRAIAGATSKVLTITGADWDDVGDYQLGYSLDGAEEVRLNADLADDNSRLYMDGITVLIEAEDYNYEGGKHKTEADSAGYRGNAYMGLKGTLNVDFFHDGDNSAGAAFAYQRAVAADEGVIEDKGGTDAVNNALGRLRGSFSVDANYALGWTQPGEWQNYTRTFPKGTYGVIGGLSHDGEVDDPPEINMILSKVASPTIPDGSSIADNIVTEGGKQTLTKLGSFVGAGTGAWSSNDLIPLQDDTGKPITIQLDGLTTLRLTFNQTDGDADFFAFYCLDCVTTPGGDAKINSVALSAGKVSINWEGANLQSSASAAGPYTNVAGAAKPYLADPTGSAKFFRAAGQ